MSPTITGANASKLARARWLVPLILVNSIAIMGQALWAGGQLVPPALRSGWGLALGAPIAFAFACALESIGIYLSAEADERARARQPYGLLRLGSYGMGALAGLLNFWHFAGRLPWSDLSGVAAPDLTLATAFAALSALSPVLWAIRSRRTNRVALVAAGLVEPRLLAIGMGRKILHPVLSYHLIRWASWQGLQDVDDAVARWDAAGRPRGSGRTGQRVATLVEAEAERIIRGAVDRAAVEAEAIRGEAEAQRAAVVVEAEAIRGEAEAQRAAVVVEAEAILAAARREAEAALVEAAAEAEAAIVEAGREAKARAEAELLEAQRRAEAELVEAARQAEAQRRAANETRREAEAEAAEILATAETLAGEARAPRRPVRDEVAEARRRREAVEAPADALAAIRAEAERLGRCPNRAEVKALCRVGSPKADALIAAYRAGDQVVEAGR